MARRVGTRQSAISRLDAERILRALAEHEVEYVLIGDLLDDLIRMKLARGRPLDLAALTDPDAES